LSGGPLAKALLLARDLYNTPIMATVPQLPVSFQLSYENFESYPQNLVYKTTYTAVLKAYAARLEEASSTIFTEKDEDADVPFRDFRGQGKFSHYCSMSSRLISGAAFERRNILKDAKLKEWIGDNSSIDPLTSTRTGALATKTDPKCRFM
jgi:hypothetical protein